MSVTLESMEELEAQPPGSVVQVGGIEWERVENGLMRDTVTLGLQHFVRYLADGKMSALNTLPWQVGRWYRNGNHWRLITRQIDDRVYSVGFGPRGPEPAFRSWPVTDPLRRWHPVALRDEDLWMRRLAAFQENAETIIPETFVRALHTYAASANDADLDDLLIGHGIGRTVDHASLVTISGHSYWTPDIAMVKGWLGDDTWTVTAIEDAATIYWRRTVQITTNGVGCMCAAVTRPRVRDYVPSGTEDFEFSVVCVRRTDTDDPDEEPDEF
jgi:hypothetical protein